MIVGVIPARLESTRFPRKILFPINNRPMIVHVYEQAIQSKELDKVIVAVDSEITEKVLKDFGIESKMTSKDHQSGTDRIAEAVADLQTDIVINIQGDEPRIDPQMIDNLALAFNDDSVKMATLASTDITEYDLNNINTVKVKIDKNNNAVDFYRQIDSDKQDYFRHIGIYGYWKATLDLFTKLPQSSREKKYKLEQLRALDNGIPIRVIKCNYKYYGIDTPEDLNQFD